MDDARTQLIAALKAHAVKNYERNGWDYLVECWTDEQIDEALGKVTSLEGAIGKVGPTLRAQNEARQEAVAAGGEEEMHEESNIADGAAFFGEPAMAE